MIKTARTRGKRKDAALNVVLIHCHYDRGGVTTVVLNQAKGLVSDTRVKKVLLLSGLRSSGIPDDLPEKVSRFQVEQLEYDSTELGVETTRERIAEICQSLTSLFQRERLSPADTILHWHNHSLGKNVALPGVVAGMAKLGWRSLLQIHDFAEDYRPSNYSSIVNASGAVNGNAVDDYLYPVASQIHYCTLTRLDTQVLRERGVPHDRIGFLPNSVGVAEQSITGCIDEQQEKLKLVRKAFRLPDHARWSVYPVRGIRRKNVGEFLLLSQLSCEDRYSAITLSPATTVEASSYKRWKGIAEHYAPRAVFDAGHQEDITFRDNLVASDLVLSTSVAEGFGMAFLEPWLFGRGVVARRLGNVVPDFESCGLDLARFYQFIMIPGDPSWIESCRHECENAFQESWSGIPASILPEISSTQLFGGSENKTDQIDFAFLSPERQIEVLRKIHSDRGFLAAVREGSPDLVKALNEPVSDEVIRHNSEIIRSEFGLSSMRDRLFQLYERLLASDIDSKITNLSRADSVMDLLMRRQVFYPCRTEQVSA